VQNALGWVALAEFRPGLLVLDGWREMSAKDSKSTYLILSAPSEGSEIRFFCKKETRLRKAGFPACAAPAFFCKNVTFMLYFYHKSLFLVKMICIDFSK